MTSGAGAEPDGYLVIEALAAARHDDDVAAAVRDYVQERADWLADQVRHGQEQGELDFDLDPQTVAHFCLALGFGTALLTPDLHDVTDEDWSRFLARVVRSATPEGTRPPAASSTTGPTTRSADREDTRP